MAACGRRISGRGEKLVGRGGFELGAWMEVWDPRGHLKTECDGNH